MTFTEIQKEVDAMSDSERDRLVAYVALRQKEQDATWSETITRRLNDKDPQHWVRLEDLEAGE